MQRPGGKSRIYFLGGAVGLLLLEIVWLPPVLAARAAQIISGNAPPFSNAHIVYILFDAVKFICLFVLGTILTKQSLKAAMPYRQTINSKLSAGIFASSREDSRIFL